MFQTNFNEETKLWSGFNVPPSYSPNDNIGHVLLRSMKSFGSKVAQVNDDCGVSLTYEEIRMKTIRAAQNLQRYGYKPKEVIQVVAGNVPDLSSIVFAAFCIGCPVNVLSTSLQKPDIIRMIGITKPSVMFCDITVYDLIKECLSDMKNNAKIFTFNGRKDESLDVQSLFEETLMEESFVPVEVDGINDVAAILCSSGTTGPFKGVCLSHANILAEISSWNVCTSDDILLSTSTLQWISGHNTLLLGTLSGATRIITTESFSPELQLRLMSDYKVSIVISVTYHMIFMLKCKALAATNLSSVKRFFIRGYRAPYAMVNEFNSYLPNGKVNQAYGLTEMSGVVAVNENGSDSAGQIISGYTFKVIDDKGNRLKSNINGDICIKPPYKHPGYYGNKELSLQVFDSEGFFLTGDIGFIDDDGNVHLIDRKKDLIIGYGKPVAPFEIEEVLVKSPDIKNVCVVGVICEETQEMPAAVIVRSDDSQITEMDVSKLVENELGDYYKLLGGVYFVPSIPTTPSGKLLRRWCKETANTLFNSKAK